ncbi:hypothetical protein D3C86_1340390 [compost metagenome]
MRSAGHAAFDEGHGVLYAPCKNSRESALLEGAVLHGSELDFIGSTEIAFLEADIAPCLPFEAFARDLHAINYEPCIARLRRTKIWVLEVGQGLAKALDVAFLAHISNSQSS